MTELYKMNIALSPYHYRLLRFYMHRQHRKATNLVEALLQAQAERDGIVDVIVSADNGEPEPVFDKVTSE